MKKSSWKIEKALTISDLTNEFVLIQTQSETRELNAEYGQEYGCYFAKLDESGTEIEELYGCEFSVPYLRHRVYKVK